MDPVVLIVTIIALIIVVAALRAAQQRKRRALLFTQARAFAAAIQQTHALPTVATDIILKSGESAFYSAPSALYETRAVRHYQGGHAGFRVAKGVWIGTTSGRSISTDEWAKIDTGRLTITNKRLVFDGGNADRSFPLSKVVSADSSLTHLELSVEGRQKRMVFDAPNPMIVAAIIHICCQFSNPLALTDAKINFEFQD